MLGDTDLDVRVSFTGRPSRNRPSWPSTLREDDGRTSFIDGIGLPIHGRNEDRIFLNLGLCRLLDWDPDVVLLFGYSDPTNILLSMLCIRRKIPYILFAEVSQEWGRRLFARVSKPIIKHMVRNARGLVPASRSAAAFFAKMGGSEIPMTIVPCVPDLARLRRIRSGIEPEKMDIRRRQELEGRFIVIYVGRLQPYKGLRELFDGMDQALRREDNLALVIVGAGPMEDYVRERCSRDPGHLKYLGAVDDDSLHTLLSISDLHVMPSWSEAFGVVCSEALAFGVPSVVTRTSGCSDLIEEGVNGFLIDPRSSASIARAILKAHGDPHLLGSMKIAASKKAELLDMNAIAGAVKDAIIAAVADTTPISPSDAGK